MLKFYKKIKPVLAFSDLGCQTSVDYSDMANVRICLDNSAEADMTLVVSNDGEYLIAQ